MFSKAPRPGMKPGQGEHSAGNHTLRAGRRRKLGLLGGCVTKRVESMAIFPPTPSDFAAGDGCQLFRRHRHWTRQLRSHGFDTVNGVAIDLFCDCPGGKIPTIFLNPGNAGLGTAALTFTLPASAATGPGSFVVSQ